MHACPKLSNIVHQNFEQDTHFDLRMPKRRILTRITEAWIDRCTLWAYGLLTMWLSAKSRRDATIPVCINHM
jgi:hypothetical protein